MSVPLHTALPSVNWGSVLLSFGAPNVKKKVAPLLSSASAQMRPPCLWIIRWTIARPTPAPSKSSGRCSRWKTPNSLSAYLGLKPTPLSRTNDWLAVSGGPAHLDDGAFARPGVLDG